MKFKKYPSITNSYDQKFIDKIKEYGFGEEIYFIAEKVHGANFSIYYDGERFRIASRQKFLADDCNFYGCQKLLPDLKEKITTVFNDSSIIEEIIVFGELCGGSYNHPDVKPCRDAKKVQGHVWYHPDNIFYIFDIKINDRYLQELDFMCMCSHVEFFYAETLFTGSLEECLTFNNTYYTHIPDNFDLPEIENNICEGNIIKPVIPLFFPNGERVILKNKNEKFKEVKRIKDPGKKIELSVRANILLVILLEHITENRLNNVVSKMGEVSIKDFGIVMKEFSHDIIEEFMSTAFNKDEMEYLEAFEQKKLRKSMNRDAANLVRNYFIKDER